MADGSWPAAKSQKFMLCADDFALSEGVSLGILELASQGRLSATGAMTNMPGWRDAAPLIRKHLTSLAVGLHLNLTTGAPLGPMPVMAPDHELPGIETWIKLSLLGRLPRAEVRDELSRQIDRFEDVLGMAPDFIDGHHHVHVLRGVHGILLDEIARRYPGRAPLVRSSGDRWTRLIARRSAAKAAVVTALAASQAKTLARQGVPTNDGFSGFSAFDPRSAFSDELDGFRRHAGPRHMIMCHPGLAAGEDLDDRYAARRLDEFHAIAGQADLPQWVWRPQRLVDGSIDWSGLDHG